MITGPWVYFFAGNEAADLLQKMEGLEGAVTHYEVKKVVPVSGESFLKNQGNRLARIETESPLSGTQSSKTEFRGGVRHLQYTTQALREELQKHSAKEIAPSSQTLAVLIPIKKSQEWWGLAQDARQQHFHKPTAGENHSTIGRQYADKIYRKLYHSRYFEALLEYDFLTYFEFDEKSGGIFESLLNDLRDVSRNPEWRFVERETEIWMTKRGQS